MDERGEWERLDMLKAESSSAARDATLLRADCLIYFFFAAIYSGGFIASLFLHKGYDAAQIGIITSFATCSAFLGNFFGGYIIDKVGSNKKPFIIALTLILIILLAMNAADSFAAVLALMMCLSFLNAPLATTLDVWILKLVSGRGVPYVTVRLFGSAGWAVSGLIMGQLLKNYGWGILPFIALPIYVLAVASVARTPDVAPSTLAGRKLQLNRHIITEMLSNRVYLLIILAAFLMNLYKFITFNFMPVVIKGVGGGDEYLGYFTFFRAAVEVPIYLIYPRLQRRFKPMALFAASIAVIPLEAIGLYFAKTPWTVVAVCTISGISFGIFLPTVRQIIFSMAPDNLKTTAQTIADSLYGSLSSALSSLVSGYMIVYLGLKTTFLCGFAVSVLAVFVCIFMLYPAAGRLRQDLV